MIINDDVFNVIKTLKDTSISLVFCDPPYNMGSKHRINPETGKPQEVILSEFMGNKWEGLTCEQLEILFKELFRITKYGAYVVMYGIDRQQMPFEYYAQLAGFDPQQYLYSYKISSFPKASDVGKMLDKREGAERELFHNPLASQQTITKNANGLGDKKANTEISPNPVSDIAKKYDGYKTSISPYKQVLETVMVFRKPYPKGMTTIDAIYEYEKGNKEISPAIVNIEAGRVKISDIDKEVIKSKSNKKNIEMGTETVFNSSNKNIVQRFDNMPLDKGRYPSQLFIVDDERLKKEIGYNTSDILDKQSGFLETSGTVKLGKSIRGGRKGVDTSFKSKDAHGYDSGGCSRINHKCLYSEEEYMIQDCLYEKDDYDILRYCTKTSTAERTSHGRLSNNHPTLKSLELNHNITKLYILPSENLKDFTVFNPFSGSGSEYIGLLSNGVLEDNIIACELNTDYYEISKARIDYWKNKKFKFRKEDKKELEKVKKKEVRENKLNIKKSIF